METKIYRRIDERTGKLRFGPTSKGWYLADWAEVLRLEPDFIYFAIARSASLEWHCLFPDSLKQKQYGL